MIQICPECRTSYHQEFPRFGCSCGRQLAVLADPVFADEPRATPAWTQAWSRPAGAAAAADPPRPPRSARPRPGIGPQYSRPVFKSRIQRTKDRFDVDDDVDDLPWQHRSRDLK